MYELTIGEPIKYMIMLCLGVSILLKERKEAKKAQICFSLS
jgi:hypothetical protein